MAAVAMKASVLSVRLLLRFPCFFLCFLCLVQGQATDKAPPPGMPANQGSTANANGNTGGSGAMASASPPPPVLTSQNATSNVTSPNKASSNSTSPPDESSQAQMPDRTLSGNTQGTAGDGQNMTASTGDQNTTIASSNQTTSENRSTPLDSTNRDSLNASTVAMTTQERTTLAPSDPCLGSPCRNGGNCHANATSYNCNCTAQWQGTNCTEDVDECLGFPCQHNGTCSNMEGGFSCACAPGTTGDKCQINVDECASAPCLNNATCVDGLNSFICNCTQGWNGTLCDQDVDECSAGLHECAMYASCRNTHGSYECPCNQGYVANGSLCSFMDPCRPNPCSHGNCVSKLTSYLCYCDRGWTGVNCTQDVDECQSDPPVCSPEKGICQNTEGSFKCSCRHGYIGDGVVCAENAMYPYSRDIGYHADDNIFGPYNVTNGFPYFGEIYHQLYISLDGAIFIGEKPDRLPTWPQTEEFPFNVRVVAPFWTDIDTFQGQGALYINVYSLVLPLAKNDNSSLAYEIVQRLSHDVTDAGVADFDPSFVMVTTWENVSPFPANLYVGIENITFQAVIATDNKRSVAVFNFLAEGNYLVQGNDERGIVIGYSDGVQPMYAVVANRTYMADKGTNVEKPGRYVFKLGDEVSNANLGCLEWHSSHELHSGNPLASDPCPCSLNQAKLDSSFQVNDTSSCATSRFPRNNITQYCCYERISGALNLGNPEGGYPLFPGETPDENEGRKLCCLQGKACHLFYQKRPSDTCERYSPPSVGVVYGDPHIATLDGSHYTFNGLGEYLMLNLNDGRFLLQGRTALNSSGGLNKTTLSAVALQGNDTEKVEVRLTPGSSTVAIHIEGTTVRQLDALTINEKVNFVGGFLCKESARMLLIQLEMKIGLKVHVTNRALWAEVIVADSYRGADSSVGLLGVFDGRADNDFKMPSGEAVVTAESERKFLIFGNNWTVSENTSLFTYSLDGPGKSWANFNFPDFMPTIFTDLLGTDMANSTGAFNLTRMKILCENSTPCLIDYVTTGNKDIAETTKDMQEYVARNQAILKSTSPRFLKMPHVLEVKAQERMKLNLSVNIKDVRFSINTTFPQNYTLNGSMLEWTPVISNNTEMQKLYFKVTARNDLGMAAIYWPTLKVCPMCENGGSCLNASADTMSRGMNPGKVYISRCVCKTGFEGATCSKAVNPCSHSPCPRGTMCTATPGVGMGYKCGECPPGFLMRHNKCYDNNECIDGSAMCSQKCENKPGSYACLCEPGFQLQADKHNCKDIDECATSNCGPNQYCTNTIGSHTCHCKASYFLDRGVCRHGPRQFGGELVFKYVNLTGAGVTSWKQEMAKPDSREFYQVATSVEEQLNEIFRSMDPDNFLDTKVYMLQKGSIIAHYHTYFTMGASPSPKSLGEALQSHLVAAGCTTSGPDCQVGDLLGVSPAWSYATATNLCLRPQDNNCDSLSTNCTSVGDGTFKCTCREGFKRWRDLTNICQDIDECANDITNTCNKTSSTCVNRLGSFKCECRPGYHQLPGSTGCTDVCEPNPCKHAGKCFASAKGNIKYSCKCTSTWTGHHCEFEHEESKRLKTAVIIVAAILGSLTLLFFILMVVCWCRYSRKHRARRAKRCYNTSEVVDGWAEPTMMIGSTPRNPSLFEMKENGNSKQNLLEQKYGVRPSDDDSSLAGEGVQNPAYTSFQPHESKKGSENF